jgi:hypothetical protein
MADKGRLEEVGRINLQCIGSSECQQILRPLCNAQYLTVCTEVSNVSSFHRKRTTCTSSQYGVFLETSN